MLHACWIQAPSMVTDRLKKNLIYHYTEGGDKGESKVEDNKHLLTFLVDITTRISGQRTVQMENKLVSHRDMELVKMAMLRHEETFRQQVHELHRLYRVQKQLMAGLSCRPSSSELSCRRQIRRRRRQPRRALDLHRHLRLPADECVVVTPPSSADDGLELTLAIGSSGGRGRRRRWDETESTGTLHPWARTRTSPAGA